MIHVAIIVVLAAVAFILLGFVMLAGWALACHVAWTLDRRARRRMDNQPGVRG